VRDRPVRFIPPLGRRRLLGAGLAAMAGLAAPAIVGRVGRAAPASLGPLALRLAWVKNAEFAGEYYADSRGYYLAEGFSQAVLQSGGPNAPPPESDLLQDKCLLGISAIDVTAAAVAQGAALRTIAAQYQKSAFCLLSLASKPIPEPKALVGRKIGVQASNQIVFSTFLRLNGIDPDDVTIVPVQFDPTPLVAGEVDGWVAYITNEPLTLKAKGIATTEFLFADHNYPLVMQTYVTRADWLSTKREQLKAALRAEIRGWQDNLRDPDGGAALTVARYGRDLGLDPVVQKMQSRTENTLLVSDTTQRSGLFTISDAAIENNIRVLHGFGDDLHPRDLFDPSLLREIYQQDPALLRA